MDSVADGLNNAFLMAWQVWWALVIGFAISAVVQAWIPRSRIEARLAGSGPRPVTLATALGAASSSCSYAAIAIAKSLFQKGASAASMLAFQFASTNLVWELGLVLWVLIGWQFTLAEYVGGIVLIALMAVLLRAFVPKPLEAEARAHAEHASAGHMHPNVTGDWTAVALNFRSDWMMLWKEILVGFLLSGFIALLGNDFFNSVFINDAPSGFKTIENVIAGPLIAVASFVCSIGNVPLAAVLWSGGISFAGVIAFIFADLIILPIIAAYRKYYGWPFTLRITALMFVTMVLAALAIDGLFSAAGLIPHTRPNRGDIFGHVRVDYKLFLNAIATVIFVTLMARAARAEPAMGHAHHNSCH